MPTGRSFQVIMILPWLMEICVYSYLQSLLSVEKKVKAKGYTLYKSRLTKALLKSIKKKNVLYTRFLNNPTAQTEFLYKYYENKLNLSLRVAKRPYYGNKIEEAKSNIKMIWRLPNDILDKKSSKQNLPTIFKSGNQELSDPAQIAEQFCKYLTNIVPMQSSQQSSRISKVLSFLSLWKSCEFSIF